jgi:hypothetical protein
MDSFYTVFLRSVRRLLVTGNVPSSSILTRATRRYIPEGGILQYFLVFRIPDGRYIP